MIANDLLRELRMLLEEIETGELENIDRVAAVAAQSIAAGGKLYVHDRGHLLNHELFMRSGGLALLRRLPLVGEKTDNVQNEWMRSERTLDEYGLTAGDVLILGSVSGRDASIVELGLQAKRRGIATIALTALDYSSQTTSRHPNGLRLYEVCEHVIDIRTRKGDAVLAIEGLDELILPSSGVTSAIAAWCLIAQLIERLLKLNVVPTVYRSVSMPGGERKLEEAKRRYERFGY